MKNRMYKISVALVTLFVAGPADAEVAVRVTDVTTLKGYTINHLVGTGLVVGLNGTGDGDQYEPTMRALIQGLGGLGVPINGIEELRDTSNVALVLLDAVIPETGAREGDRIDIHVSAIGSAKSLAGGRLLIAPLVFRDPTIDGVFAFAQGALEVSATSPTTGVIRFGALVNEDVLLGYTATGSEVPFANDWIQEDEIYITLVVDEAHAGWGMSVAIAEAINAELSLTADVERVAVAADPRNVVVWVPKFQRADPAAWIRDIEELSTLMPAAEARVSINRKTGTIVISGDARVSPAIVSHKGMTVTVRSPAPDPDEPSVESNQFVGVASGAGDRSSMSDLLQSLNQLKVPVDDRIAILTQLQRAGKLHAKLIFRD